MSSSTNKIIVYSVIAMIILIMVAAGLGLALEQIYNNRNNDELNDTRVYYTEFILILLLIIIFFLFIYLFLGAIGYGK